MKSDSNPITIEIQRREKEISALRKQELILRRRFKIALKKEVKRLAKITINNARIKTYGRLAGNVGKGDYGDWKDWQNLLEKFGNSIVDIAVPEPKHKKDIQS